MKHKTRKSKAGKGVKSIPELRRAFEHIEPVARSLASQVHNKKMTKTAASEVYAKEWKKVFGRPMKKKSAEASIEHYMSLSPRQRGGEPAELIQPSASGQKGGSAPVNWSDTQPGIYAAPTLPGQVDAAGYTAYGSFLPYVEKGFSVGIPADGLAATCDGKNSWPMPAADIGNNQVPPKGDIPLGATTYIKPQGGGKRKTRRKQRGGAAGLAAAFRPFESTNPTGVAYDAMTAFKGMTLPASPDPSDPAFSYRTNNVQVPQFGTMDAINRNLSVDVSYGKK